MNGGMRPVGTPNRARRQASEARAGQVVVTLVAVALGVGVAWLFLSTGPFKAATNGDAIELAGGATARAHLLSAGSGGAGDSGSSGGGKREKAVGGGAAEEDAWFKKLSSGGCKATEELRVCSHRARSSELTDVYPGSLSAYGALWKAKVK